MKSEFDPYHRWLGIHPREQPADHYRLLGLAPFEEDAEVIDDAAERQIASVRRHQLGQHVALTQEIINELAAARICLLDPGKKAEYDTSIQATMARPSSHAGVESGMEENDPKAMEAPRPSSAPPPITQRKATSTSKAKSQDIGGRWFPRTSVVVIVVLGGVAGILLAAALPWRAFQAEKIDPPARSGKVASPTDSNPEPEERQQEQKVSLRAPVSVPTESARQESARLIEEVYHIASHDARGDQQALATKLLEASRKQQISSSDLFVLLKLSTDLGSKSGNAEAAIAAADGLAAQFWFDAEASLHQRACHELQVRVLSDLADSVNPSDKRSLELVFERALDNHDAVAVNREYSDTSLTYAQVAHQVARQINQLEAVRRASDAIKRATDFKQMLAIYERRSEVPRDDPANANAHLALGRFLCFVEGDWTQGLEHLTLGGDPLLKSIAEKERTPDKTADQHLQLGDEWSQVAERELLFAEMSWSKAAEAFRVAAEQLPGCRPRVEKTLARFESAFVFDGDAFIESSLERFGPVTLEAWVKPDPVQSSELWGPSRKRRALGMFIGSDLGGRYGLGIGSFDGRLALEFLRGFIETTAEIPIRWSHVAVAFGHDNTNTFLNGKLVSSEPASSFSGGTHFVMGQFGVKNANGRFTGQIRSIRISQGARYGADFTPPVFLYSDNDTSLAYDAFVVGNAGAVDLASGKHNGVLRDVTVDFTVR